MTTAHDATIFTPAHLAPSTPHETETAVLADQALAANEYSDSARSTAIQYRVLAGIPEPGPA